MTSFIVCLKKLQVFVSIIILSFIIIIDSEEVIEIDVFRIKIRMKQSRGDDDENSLSTITCLIEDSE